MKKLYIRLVNFLGSLPVDKYIHFMVCLILTMILYKLIPLAMLWKVLISFSGTVLVGITKETYDYLDYGLFDKKDLFADILGSFAGILISIIP